MLVDGCGQDSETRTKKQKSENELNVSPDLGNSSRTKMQCSTAPHSTKTRLSGVFVHATGNQHANFQDDRSRFRCVVFKVLCENQRLCICHCTKLQSFFQPRGICSTVAAEIEKVGLSPGQTKPQFGMRFRVLASILQRTPPHGSNCSRGGYRVPFVGAPQQITCFRAPNLGHKVFSRTFTGAFRHC